MATLLPMKQPLYSKDKSTLIPTSLKEMRSLGLESVDVILFTGDAFIDHPSFGAAVIARLIEKEGYSVAVVPQPNWKDDLRDFKKLGRPNLFFAVTAGNMDSMVNHYTAARRLRSDDAYTAGGKAGFRPDYPTVVYTRILKEIWPDVPVVLGGMEASMRRLAHYDYWSDKVEPSLLITSGADLLVYGMAEEPVKELLRLVSKGVPFYSLRNLPQTSVTVSSESDIPVTSGVRNVLLNSFEEVVADKKKFGDNFITFEKESNKAVQSRLIEPVGSLFVVVNPAIDPSHIDPDYTYDLPYTYLPHPRYNGKGAIPAYEMIKNSVNIHRGCFGGCSFCAIAAHQGKRIISRSEESVIKEVEKLTSLPGFNGVITDLGGPSANMYKMEPVDTKICEACIRPSCIYPSVCKNITTDHGPMNRIYKKVSDKEGVKRVFIGSGVRYDLLLKDHNKSAGLEEKRYLENLITRHVSGRLKVAPEHSSPDVLALMRKPGFGLYRKLVKEFSEITTRKKLKYEIVPYLISSHPGCSEAEMGQLAVDLKDMNIRVEQVQDFTPTPMTLSTTIYYCGFNPYNGKKVFTARSVDEKRRQKDYFFWYKPGMIKELAMRLNRIGKKELASRLSGGSDKKRR